MSGVSKRFGPTQALRGVDLELRAGEVHALVGSSSTSRRTSTTRARAISTSWRAPVVRRDTGVSGRISS